MMDQLSRPTVLIVGRGPASAQAALELAEAGAWVTLLTPNEGLIPGADGPLQVPRLLEASRHPKISLLAGTALKKTTQSGDRLRVTLRQSSRYVNSERCTSCGVCAEVCPVPVLGDNGSSKVAHAGNAPRKAIYRGNVPTTFVIDKAGMSPCRNACPIHQRAQGYIALIGAGNYEAAYDIIRRDNPFPSVCGRVCNHRCEDACSRSVADAAVNIMGLKRFVADRIGEKRARGEPVALPTNGGDQTDANRLVIASAHKRRSVVRSETSGCKVAVVGAGPAGLTCALDLVRNGHAVTVYEALPVAGGMMRVGVPEYRLPHHLIQREINDILAEGVKLVLNHRVNNVPMLLKNGFDAVFVAIGAHDGVRLPIPGADLPEVLVATEFLRAVSLKSRAEESTLVVPDREKMQGDSPFCRLSALVRGKRVLVLGGGNVAVDVAMTAVRLGASWSGMACLESREQMPAHDWEIRDAEEEGVEIFPSRTFKEIRDGHGRVSGVRCAQIDFRGFREGRPDFDELPDTEHVIPADVVVFAIGQRPQLGCMKDQAETIRGSFLAVDPETLATSLPGVFAGGDVLTGTAFIVDAIAAGHTAARSMDCYLRGVQTIVEAEAPRLPPVELDEAEVQRRLSIGQAVPVARIVGKKRPAHERRHDFGEFHAGLTEAEAQAEAARCLSCGVCSECLQCEELCPAGAIRHETQPRIWESSVDAILWADPDLPFSAVSSRPVAEPPGVFVAENGFNLADALSRTHTYLGVTPSVFFKGPAAPSRWRFSSLPSRIGVFLCACGGEIDRVVDLSALAGRVKGLQGVEFVDQIDFACHVEGSTAIREKWVAHDLDGAVLAACSCCGLDQICYSCTTQRMRCKERLGVWDGLAGLPFQFVNVREQCAFVHRDDPTAATKKARDLVTASVAALLIAHQGYRIATSQYPFPNMQYSAVNSRYRIPITAAIDPVRCRGCEDCELVCGLEAMQVLSSNGARVARVDLERCLGCGVCMAVCSSGAILAGDTSDAQAEAMLAAMGDLSDKTVIFTCNWGAYSAIEAAGTERLSYDPSVRVLRLMCSGRAHTGLIMQAFVQGAAGVLVLTCGPTVDATACQGDASQCHYQTGGDQARRSVQQTKRLLRLLAIDPARLAILKIDPGNGFGFAALLEEFMAAAPAAIFRGCA